MRVRFCVDVCFHLPWGAVKEWGRGDPVVAVLRGLEGGQPVREAAAPSDRPGAGGEGARSLTPSPHCRHLPF